MAVRTSQPNAKNKYYLHISKGGYNKCILISGDSCLPNCVGYAYGRYMEMAEITKCNLPVCNAEDWYAQAKKNGYKVGSTPKVGAIIVWRKGHVGKGSDGAGHVAVVEEIYNDGSILISQSGYNSSRFWTSKLAKGYKLSGYALLGFIYNNQIKTKTGTKKAYSGNFPSLTYKSGNKTVTRALQLNDSRSGEVKKLQKFLNWYGSYGLDTDGSFGYNTQSAVKKFQKAENLEVDGLFGTASLKAAKAVKK